MGCSGRGSLPEPVSVFIPSAVNGNAQFREEMMKEKTPVAFKITEVLAMFMWFVTLGQGFVQGHGLGRFSSHTNMVEVDGVVPFVLFRSDDDSITRHCFIDSHIDTDEETDDNETDYYDSNYLVTLLSSHTL